MKTRRQFIQFLAKGAAVLGVSLAFPSMALGALKKPKIKHQHGTITPADPFRTIDRKTCKKVQFYENPWGDNTSISVELEDFYAGDWISRPDNCKLNGFEATRYRK